MTENSSANMERFKTLGRSAFIVGYTGATGKALVDELNKLKIFKRVVLIGRREVPLNVGPEFEQKVINFDKIEEHKDVFQGLDTGFCCLGTTRAKAGREGFIRIDRDYVLNSAEVAKTQGCQHFSIVSAREANANSCILYSRIKGEVEESLRDMNFERLTILRPAFIEADRQETRPLEVFFKILTAPVMCCCRSRLTVPATSIAKAMINNAMVPMNSSFEILTNKDIHLISGSGVKGCCGS